MDTYPFVCVRCQQGEQYNASSMGEALYFLFQKNWVMIQDRLYCEECS